MKKKLLRYGMFLYLWLMLGYVLGTLLLVGPVQWINTVGRSFGWAHSVERLVMIMVISAYIGTTFWLTQRLLRWLDDWNSRAITSLICVVLTLLGLLTVWAWLNPAWMLGETSLEATQNEYRFVFGSYPTPQRIRQLEDRGFTAVVSLLHPAVVPFEPQLIKREKKRLQSSSLDFIQAPILPWVGDNEESLDKLRQLARSDTGKYYVHCYLGRDRVHLARRVIQQAGGDVQPTGKISRRRLAEVTRLERGKVFDLGDSVFLTPYPTREEFMAFIFNGTVRHVVSLMEPDSEGEADWVEREQRIMNRYDFSFSVRPIPTSPNYDPDNARRVVEYVRTLPRPVVVHDFLSDQNAPAAEAFVLAYRFEDLPPLPPSLFSFDLERGPVRVVDVNRVVGPRPQSSEVGSYLANRGIRAVLYVGTESKSSLQSLRATVRQEGLRWERARGPASKQFQETKNGGPWYLFGPELPSTETHPTRRLREALAGFEGFPSRSPSE